MTHTIDQLFPMAVIGSGATAWLIVEVVPPLDRLDEIELYGTRMRCRVIRKYEPYRRAAGLKHTIEELPDSAETEEYG